MIHLIYSVSTEIIQIKGIEWLASVYKWCFILVKLDSSDEHLALIGSAANDQTLGADLAQIWVKCILVREPLPRNILSLTGGHFPVEFW